MTSQEDLLIYYNMDAQEFWRIKLLHVNLLPPALNVDVICGSVISLIRQTPVVMII